MKTTAQKTHSSSSNSYSFKPFFNKSGERSFFSNSKKAEQPFFSPSFIQPKLTIGQPNDKYEQEADAMADQVVQSESIRRQSVPEKEEMLQRKLLQRRSVSVEEEMLQSSQLKRQTNPEEEEMMQTKPLMRIAENGAATATPQFIAQLNSSKGSGQPLPKDTLSSMNNVFGTDFSSVRVHTGSRAQEMSRGIQAKAFTHGSDIYFNKGQYNSGSTEGKRLLGHELTHVVQQGDMSRKTLRTKKRVQGQGLAIAGLGVAVFSEGRSIATSGDLSHQANVPSYMHPNTPANARWTTVTRIIKLKAWHPRYFQSNPSLYFRLSYQFNGYDIRNATINLLRERSSGMYLSSFSINWDGQKHSRPTEPHCAVIFNISGRWDPFGRGDYSFWGRLIISQDSRTSYMNLSVSAESNSVWQEGFLSA